MTKQIKNKVFAFFTFYDIQSFPYYIYSTYSKVELRDQRRGLYCSEFYFFAKIPFWPESFCNKKKRGKGNQEK